MEEKDAQKGERKPWTLREFGGQTVWDWLHLLSTLAIPVVLAIGGFWFTAQQDTRQQQIEDRRAQQAQKIENQRAEAERELAEQRAQDEAVQAYFDQMSGLLLERDLRESAEDSEVRTLARGRTLTVLERVGPSRKAAVMQFLVEAELVQRVGGRGPIITLTDANLRNTDLQLHNLSGANLENADLTRADVDSSNLRYANLSNADLEDANLSDANLGNADLSYADLTRATLGSNLNGADLFYANLSNTDLSNSEGVTNEQLEEEKPMTLEGATMPDGSEHP